MKILHLCICGEYTDNWSYQENLIPKYHKKMGYDVTIVASPLSFSGDGKKTISLPNGTHYLLDGTKVIRIPFNKWLPYKISKRFRIMENLYLLLLRERPDIIFVHGVQTREIKNIKKYMVNFPNTKLFIDNHADFSNSARTFTSKILLHGIVWKFYARSIEKYVDKFYGVLPARTDFLVNMYKLPPKKVELLIMGGDDEYIDKYNKYDVSREYLQESFSIDKNDFIIATIGKIDIAKKEIFNLIESVKNIENSRTKLLIFGSVIDELKSKFDLLIDNEKIIYGGWLNNEQFYKIFNGVDLCVFPGRHSVYWEQCVSIGKPIIAKKWEGTEHVNTKNNVLFVENSSVEELSEAIIEMRRNYSLFKTRAEKAQKGFRYSEISKISINI
ncbi:MULTISPECIES: glycosyltransferase [Enterococcus]|nr:MULTISPECIES: glycosyltransferase [Enterococcus]MBC9721932.1 glycosyltransferase family 4 protein [Lactobacillus sp.]AWX47238.1 glycosyltransferase [Enterococcus faecium]EGP4873076.1 glycosyltransferase family 4 protein [Enterococcus faecium]EGP5191403.1 glycosyltransferase [Enterococcus faecium]EJV43446.1 glycosyltransferase, group 1 family protein [Enterococcus faecium TX1337RF]